MRVLVCGGRYYGGRETVYATLDKIDAERGPITALMHGASRGRNGELRGADRWADQWALGRLIPPLRFEADWQRYGRAAGPKRNATMLEVGKPDLGVALPGGAGTADMVRKLKAAGIPVVEIVEPQP